MKFVYGSITIVLFAMAVLGAFGAAHGMEHGGGCFLATAAGMTCVGDIAASLNMHFDALRAFSLAVFAASLAAAFLVVFARLLRVFIPPSGGEVFISRLEPFAISHKPFASLRWLSRLEHSPSFLFG